VLNADNLSCATCSTVNIHYPLVGIECELWSNTQVCY